MQFWTPDQRKAPEADPIEAPDWITWRVYRQRNGVYVAQFHDRRTGRKLWVTADSWRLAIEWVREQVRRSR